MSRVPHTGRACSWIVTPYVRSMRRQVCRAIIKSSSVGMTHAEALLPDVEILGPLAAFAVLSSSSPSQDACSQTRRRISGACSPNSGRKDEGVEPAQRGGERTELPTDAIDEQIDGLGRMRLVTFEQRFHIIADARDAEQP